MTQTGPWPFLASLDFLGIGDLLAVLYASLMAQIFAGPSAPSLALRFSLILNFFSGKFSTAFVRILFSGRLYSGLDESLS